MSDLGAVRRFFAEEIQVVSNIRSATVVDALAAVPRERFVPPGPWTIRSESDFGGPPRQTPGADARFVYHNVAVAIDADRMLFNGTPGLVAMAIDRADVKAGERVLHIGTGTGYFTALMAHCVGPQGRVVGIEVDEGLAQRARENVSTLPWVEIHHGDGTGRLNGAFDVIVVNAGVTHPLDSWLDALAPGGRLVLPITATMPAMGPIGKGLLLLLTRDASTSATMTVRPLTFVAIFSAVGLRDERLNAQIGQALAKHPFPPLQLLRRDPHEPSARCWLHDERFCLTLAERPGGVAVTPG